MSRFELPWLGAFNVPRTWFVLHTRRMMSKPLTAGVCVTDMECRGSKFLRAWMEFLEEHADLRYPNIAEVYVDAE